jgi:hypothetical protein
VSADDQLLAVVALPAGDFAAGATYPETTNLALDVPLRSYLPTGPGKLILVVDPDNRITEANEANNLFVISVTMQH